MRTRIFISRPLAADSAFRRALDGHDIELFDESMIQFHPLPFFQLPDCDWLFFYSQKGVQFFFDQWITPLPEHIRLAGMGAATARALEQRAGRVDFSGTGNPEETAKAFLLRAANQKVLFPRASHSRRSIQRLLTGYIQAIDLVVYRNTPKRDTNIPDCNLLVFTSPLNARYFLQQYPLKDQQEVVAIGQTTAEALRQLGCPRVHIARQSTEEAMAEVVISLLTSDGNSVI
ncbi:MAG: uroporphyrinogen-III synthase [Bacteroidota bacterium]